MTASKLARMARESTAPAKRWQLRRCAAARIGRSGRQSLRWRWTRAAFSAQHALSMPPLILHQPTGAWGEPSLSPFCVKLECYLRMAEIPYEVRQPDVLKAPKGKFPYVELDGKLVGDSQLIIDELVSRYGDRLDHALTREQRALARVTRRAIEESAYFAGLYARWGDDAGWEILRPAFARSSGIPELVLRMVRRRVRANLHGHGMGRHTGEEIYRMGMADWSAISDLLGDRPFFFGDRATSIDAVLFGFVTATTVFPYDSPLRKHVTTLGNLTAHRDRVRQRWFEAPVPTATK
jgi:glutathione S-transferase